MGNEKLGSYAFLLGAALVLISSIFSGLVAGMEGIILLALVVLGLVVGVLNISDKEVGKFLVASIALILVGSANLTAANTVVFGLGTIMQTIVVNLARFVAPAALVVALKSIFSMAKEK